MAVDYATIEPEVGEPLSLGGARAALNPTERMAQTEKLLDEHHAAVFRYAYRLCGCTSTAEDIAQEVFLRAFRSLHQLREEQAARGWLLVITRNEFARWCRHKSETIGIDLDAEVGADLEQPPELEQNEWVEHALQQLPNDFRLVLVMFYFEELSYAEIAEQLQIPIGTVMSRLSRGRTHMKTALANGLVRDTDASES